jgi:hypothetical protein
MASGALSSGATARSATTRSPPSALKKPLALYLAQCKSVTDASIKSLSQLSKSSDLHINLQGTGITAKGLRQLRAALPKAQISWASPD